MANRHRDARDNVVEDAQRNIWLIDVEQQQEQESQRKKGFESIWRERSYDETVLPFYLEE